MKCDFEEEVSAWFDGELPEADAERVRAHVAGCTSCRQLVADFESVRASVRALRTVDVEDAATARRFWRRRVSIPLPAAAVLVVLFVGAPFIAFRRGESTHAPMPAPILRQSDAGLLARYDGGGRAVIAVRPKEKRR